MFLASILSEMVIQSVTQGLQRTGLDRKMGVLKTGSFQLHWG